MRCWWWYASPDLPFRLDLMPILSAKVFLVVLVLEEVLVVCFITLFPNLDLVFCTDGFLKRIILGLP